MKGNVSNINDSFHGKPDAGNLHVRFVEGKGGRKTPFLLYRLEIRVYSPGARSILLPTN